MRHVRWFQPAFLNCFQWSIHLIFITCNLLRGIIHGYSLIIRIQYFDRLRIIDVFHYQMTFITWNDSHTVGSGMNACLQGSHLAILKQQCNIFLRIHSRIRFLTDGMHGSYFLPEIHGSKVEQVHTQIEQGAACQFRTQDTFLPVNYIP